MKEKIKDILKNELSYIYCHNCKNNGNDNVCDYCHRKSMSWEISDSCADKIADKILGEYGN